MKIFCNAVPCSLAAAILFTLVSWGGWCSFARTAAAASLAPGQDVRADAALPSAPGQDVQAEEKTQPVGEMGAVGSSSPSAADDALSLAADRDWRFVQKLKDDGMLDVAARQLNAFASEHHADARAPGALVEAAAIYRKLDQPLNALAAYEKLLKQFPTAKEAPRALLQKGELLVALKRFEEAASAYRSLLTSFPASREADAARLGLGESMMALEKTDEAARLFRSLVGGRASGSLASRALFDLGVLAQKAGEDSLAIVRFDSVHESYPQEVVGAFGLLRSAGILASRDAPEAARERYETVIEHYKDPYLQARADLGLAILDEEAQQWAKAAVRYRAVAERGGSPEQVQRALLGLGECELRNGHPKKAREAAEVYLEKYPQAPKAERARLLMARADAARGDKAARDELIALSRSDDTEVAFEALSTLARMTEERAKELPDGTEKIQTLAQARDFWRDASAKATEADQRARAFAEAGRITAEEMQRHALAAEFYRQAFEAAESRSLQATVLGHQVEEEEAAGETGLARKDAERLIAQYPLSAEAAQARSTLRRQDQRLQANAPEAVRRLCELALSGLNDPLLLRMKVGVILRDVAGDPAAATEIFQTAAAQADDPSVAARVFYELGRSWLLLAFEAALKNPQPAAWEEPWESARKAFLSAAASAPQDENAMLYRIAALKMDLAAAASKASVPLFDADLDPLFAGMGEQEALDFRQGSWPLLAQKIGEVLKLATNGSERPWLLWRAAEVSVAADSTQRLAWLREGLKESPSEALQARLRYTLGQLLLAGGEDEEAAVQLRKVIESPVAGEVAVAARYAMAELQRKQRRYNAARDLYQAYASAYPETRRGQRALLLAGDMALYAGDADGAAVIYRSLLDRYPEGVYADDAGYRLATAQMRRGRREDARRRFTHLADPEIHSRYAGRSLLKLSELESWVGRDSMAVVALERLARVDPELARKEQVPLKLARLELKRENPQGALRWLDRLEEESPSAESLALRVEALARAGKVKQAQETFTRLNDGFPDAALLTAGARCDVGDAQLAAKDAESAMAGFRMVQQEPVTADLQARAFYGEGMCLLLLQRWDDARQAFAMAAKVAPDSDWAAQALFKVANLAAHQADDEGARKAYQELADRFPDHPLQAEALKGLAMSWRRLNRYDKAIEVYHRLLEEHPGFPHGEQILSDIAYCYHELGKYELSIAAYQRVLPLLSEEDQAYGQFWIADSLEKLSRYDEAAAAYLKIPYLYPKSGQLPVTAQLKAARVYERMGDVDSAKRLYAKVIKQYGAGSQWGAEAQRRLQAIVPKTDADS